MARLISRAPNGVIVGDQRKDQILLLQDKDGDGTVSGAEETTVFFDENNASGLEAPTQNVFTIHQASDKSVFAGDGSTDTVYKLTDLNNDGDAQDVGEAAVWFSADNAAGLSTVTPNGIHEGADGAIYVANAGVRSAPQDAIYRTVNLNGDGDANDEGEATVWLDVQTIVDTAVPFDLSFDGDVAYLSDLAGAETDVIYRIEDTNGDGTIQEDEVTNFISDDMNFGAPVDIANAVAVDGALYTLTWFPSSGEELKLFRLTDLDGSGQIDDAAEAVEVWNASAMPEGLNAEIGFSVAADEDGNVVLTGNDFGGNSHVISLTDMNGDGDFLDEGETAIYGSNTYDDQLTRARAVEFFEGTAQVAASTVGAGKHFSVFLDSETNTLYTSGENVVGQLGIGETGFEVKTPVAVEMAEGFDAQIVSVSAGLLHTTFLTDEGDVYSFGFNNRGPLGTGDEETRTTAVKIEALDDVNITSIENGNSVSYAISDTGTLYAWGNNSNGQLVLGDQDERLEPTVVGALENEIVVSISSGTSHTLALTADGQVWAFGSNTDGQLGSPDALEEDGSPTRRSTEPVLVEGLPANVTSVTADTKTSFAVTEDGRVFGWGESRFGQLLQGSDNGDGTFEVDEADVLAPVELTELMPEGVIEIKGGARWFMALTDDGDIYAWGPNDEGPTGGLDGDPATEGDANFYPTLVAELDDVNVVELHTGPNSIIAVTDTGEIFTLGLNSDGRLGFSSEGSVYAPTQIELGGEADPFLVSATPSDNGRDIANDAALTLNFTEEVQAGEGTLTLVNRDSGERTEIDVTDQRLVSFDAATVTVTPPEHLHPDARYYVEITDGAFEDLDGNAYEGIPEGDRSTFNFTTSEEAAASESVRGTRKDDVLRGGSDDDVINGKHGDDIVSGAGGDDWLNGGRGDDAVLGGEGNDWLTGGLGNDMLDGGADNDWLKGGWGRDDLKGGAGNDWLKGGWGNDVLDGGTGNDVLVGGWGVDTFVFNGGHDTIRDFEAGFDWWFWSAPGDQIAIDIEGIDSFGDLIANAVQDGWDTVISFNETDSLTLNNTWLSELDNDTFTFV
ncbi:Ig-like domain-containing protein [Ruegeria arenilitoris]|uniref:RCC1 domain-containing protein n=1 Tax=Ruegeria arenilitoris TaxID=1173585 RepID=UPI00147FB6FD|nr:Ig-like domain-containing protein [Ruegeria arenilitoris]